MPRLSSGSILLVTANMDFLWTGTSRSIRDGAAAFIPLRPMVNPCARNVDDVSMNEFRGLAAMANDCNWRLCRPAGRSDAVPASI